MIKIKENFEIGEIDNSIVVGDCVRIKLGFENSKDEIGKHYKVTSKRNNTLYIKWINSYANTSSFPIKIDYVTKVDCSK